MSDEGPHRETVPPTKNEILEAKRKKNAAHFARIERRVAREKSGSRIAAKLVLAEHEAAVAFARNHPTPKTLAGTPAPPEVVSDVARERMRTERLQDGWG